MMLLNRHEGKVMRVLIPVQDAEFGDAIADMLTKHNWTPDTQFRFMTVIDFPRMANFSTEHIAARR